MTPESLPSMLRNHSAVDPGRGPACPGEHALATYVDGTLGVDSREGIEVHLADCDACLALVGLLSRERGVDATDPVDDLAIARAQALVRPQSRRHGSSAPQWAAAAVVVVALVSLVRLSQPVTPTEIVNDRSNAPTTRAAAADTQVLRLLSPSPGASVSASELAVRWTPVPGAHYYDVRVVTDAGDVVTEEHVTGTEWHPTNPAALRPGTEYFVHVDAFIADDKTVSSKHVAFRVSD